MEKLKIGIYCGESSETWSPKSEASGIGGSEEAVINISRELAKRGHNVTVWNHCGSDADEYDGVDYRDFLDYEADQLDIAIGWRSSRPFRILKNFKKGYLWLHDTMPFKDVALALELGADKAMMLSKYHRRLYPAIRNEEVFLTRNGINPKHFDQKVEKVKGRMFWGSSYDRGLAEVLELWPKIKDEIPEATLHICYGWETMEKTLGKDSENYKAIREKFDGLFNQEGVVHLGRISHEEVAKEMLEAEVWGYPTWWPETSCITAMKAQVAGAIPVVIPTAAVAETVKMGIKTDRSYYHDIRGNVTRPEEALDQWLNGVVETLKNPDEKFRKRMMDWAKDYFDWAKVAEEWEKEFTNEL